MTSLIIFIISGFVVGFCFGVYEFIIKKDNENLLDILLSLLLCLIGGLFGYLWLFAFIILYLKRREII